MTVNFRSIDDGGYTQTDGEERHELTGGASIDTILPDTVPHEEEAGDAVEDHQEVGQWQIDQENIARSSHAAVAFKVTMIC